MRFARCERDPHRQAAAIDHRMYLAGQTASRPAHGLTPVAGDASGVLMNTHNGRVDHLDRCIMRSSQCVHHPAPNVSATPANEAVVASGIGTELLRQIPPRCTGSQYPEDAVQDTTVVHPWNAARLVWQHRLDRRPLMVGEFITHDSRSGLET